MDKSWISAGVWIGLGAVVALGILNALSMLLSPLDGAFFAGLCALFAWGIWRRVTWAAIAAILYEIVPMPMLSLPDTRPEFYIAMAFIVCAKLAFAAAFLVAAIILWKERAAHRATPWLVILALMLAGFVSLRAYAIPTPAMEDTLRVGDRILAEKASMLLGRAPQNGEIVVFRYPKDKAKLFVKRVVGVPKDRLRMEGERLYRNGALVKEEHAVYRSGRFRQFERFPPSDDSGWGRAEDGNPFANNIENGEVVVPDGQYFVLGDNRDNSLDSRYWGFVPNEDILARAVVIYGSYEPDEDSGTPSFLDRTIRNFRWSRVLKRLS